MFISAICVIAVGDEGTRIKDFYGKDIDISLKYNSSLKTPIYILLKCS